MRAHLHRVALVAIGIIAALALTGAQHNLIVAQKERLMDLSLRNQELESQVLELNREIQREAAKWVVITLWTTGYAPFDNRSGVCNDGTPSTTSTGTSPSWGTIAVNPRVIPYGTRMYVEGYGWGVAEDTGSAIRARADLIDLYFDTYTQAIQWGRRQVRVLIERGE